MGQFQSSSGGFIKELSGFFAPFLSFSLRAHQSEFLLQIPNKRQTISNIHETLVVTPLVITHEENERSKKCKASSHLNAFTCGLTLNFFGDSERSEQRKKIAPLQLQKYVQSVIMRSHNNHSGWKQLKTFHSV